ncbi:MAG: hypothetical protein AB1705_05855 [Verrucomicrobiota bacterium]
MLKPAAFLLFALALNAAAQTKPVFENNFEAAKLGELSEDFLVLDGGFAVKEESGNKFLELPGAPLETFGVLFGPTEPSGIAVSARFHSTGKGRRFPTFGVGLNGVGGYRLLVTPAKKAVELFRGDHVIATVPYDWPSDKWVFVRLQVRKLKSGAWKVEGKAWTQGETEPAKWMISADDKEELAAGRPSIWGLPFAGTPIRFDDLTVTAAKD